MTGIATSKTRVGSTCLKLKRPAGSGLIANGSTIRDFSLGSRVASPRGDEHAADERPRGRADQHVEIVPLAQRFRRFHAPPPRTIHHHVVAGEVARPMGIEPVTYRLEGGSVFSFGAIPS